MTQKQNPAIWKELNGIELEIASYLINSDDLIFEALVENSRFTNPLLMGEYELSPGINSPTDQSRSGVIPYGDL